MQKQFLASLICLCTVSTSSALAETYLTVGGYYSKVDKPIDRSGSGGLFGIGYSLSDQWSLEFGYDQLLNKKPRWPHFADHSNQILSESRFKSTGLTLSVLGKTTINDANTLFYRVGAIRHQSDALVFRQAPQTCGTDESLIHSSHFIVNDVVVGNVSGCLSANTNIGLIYGLGLDHQFNQQWFSRIELVGVADPDTKSIHALKLAVGYRF